MKRSHSVPGLIVVAFFFILFTGSAVEALGEIPGWRLPAKPRPTGTARDGLGTETMRGPSYPMEPYSESLVQRARQGSADAEYNLGRCYQNGNGVQADQAEAVRWYRKASRQGHAWAQSNLGWCYLTGLGVPPDIEEAIYWYRRALMQGDAGAQFHLGELYFQGKGVTQNLEEAIRLWKMSARQGYQAAIDACRHHGVVLPSN